MKTIKIATLVLFIATIISCSKEKNTTKQTRLTSYTYSFYQRIPVTKDSFAISYNSAKKIDKVLFYSNGILYETSTCVYNSSNRLDSLVFRNTGGIITEQYALEWTDGKISKINTSTFTYNSNGLVDKKTYNTSEYFRNEYIGDSVILFQKQDPGTELVIARYKLSTTIKNPFYLPDDVQEGLATSILFYYPNSFNALLPFIEIADKSYIGTSFYDQAAFVFDGSFDGYPLKSTSSTNPIIGNRSIETFNYAKL